MQSGNLFKAWQASYTDFQNIEDMTDAQKQLKHYVIGLTQDETHYVVLYRALLLPQVSNGEVIGVTRGTIGRTTRYWIDKQDFSVSKRLFYKG